MSKATAVSHKLKKPTQVPIIMDVFMNTEVKYLHKTKIFREMFIYSVITRRRFISQAQICSRYVIYLDLMMN